MTALTEFEKLTAKKICQKHKFTHPSDLQILTLRAFVFGIGVINLLLQNGQYDVILAILVYLTPKELVNVAAATEDAFVELFWSHPYSKMRAKFSQHFFLKSYFHNEPDQKRLLSLKTGSEILREYRYLFIHVFFFFQIH